MYSHVLAHLNSENLGTDGSEPVSPILHQTEVEASRFPAFDRALDQASYPVTHGCSSMSKDNWRARHNAKPVVVTRTH